MTLSNIRDLLIMNNREILIRIEDLKNTIDIIVDGRLDTLKEDLEIVSNLLEESRKTIETINNSSLNAILQRLDDIDSTIKYIQDTAIKDLELKDQELSDKINVNIQDIKDINDAAAALTKTVQDHIDNAIIHVTQEDKDLWNKTLQDAKDYAKDLFDGVTSFTIELVSILPTGDNIKEMVIYFVPNLSNDTANYYDEYMYINGQWEIVGNTRIDLTPYVKTDDLNKTLQDYVLMSSLTTILNDYVLSTDLVTTLQDYVTNTSLSMILKDYTLKTDSHSHPNKDVLDLLSSSDGKLLYNNKEISSEEILTNQQIQEAAEVAITEINS